MCSRQEEIFTFDTGKKISKGQLSESDEKMCIRILLEVYNKYPESVMFRDCSDLNFKAYLDIIKEPIGKKHALKKYDQFALNTSCFYPSCAISQNFCYKSNEKRFFYYF